VVPLDRSLGISKQLRQPPIATHNPSLAENVLYQDPMFQTSFGDEATPSCSKVDLKHDAGVARDYLEFQYP